MARQVVDSFGPPSARVSPSVYVRRWDEGLLGTTLGLVGGYCLTAWLTWRTLPGLGPVPYGDAMQHVFSYWPRLLAAPWSEWSEYYWNAYRSGGILRCGLSVGMGLILGTWFGISGFKPRNNIKWISGPELRKGQEALREAARITKQEKPVPWLWLHPKLGLTKRSFTRFTLLIGSPGSGKTQILHGLLKQIYAQNRKCFLYDVKGDFSAAYPGLLVSPWDARSAVWDVGYDVSTIPAARNFVASIIVPDQSEHGSFWTKAAQELLFGCVRSLQNERGINWGFKLLAEYVRAEQPAFVERLRRDHPKAEALIADAKSTATSSVLATLSAHTRVIEELALAWGDLPADTPRVRLTAWARDGYQGPRQIIVQGGEPQLANAYISAMVNVCAANVVSAAMPDSKHDRALFFVLDELASLRVNIAPFVDKGRSKGVALIAAVQDFTQLIPMYGQHLAQAIVSMASNKIICQVQSGETRTQLAELFGKHTVAITETQSNGSHMTREENRPVVKPNLLTSELGTHHHKKGFTVRAIVQVGGHDPLLLDYPGIVMPEIRKGYVPAEWVKVVQAREQLTDAAEKSEPEEAQGGDGQALQRDIVDWAAVTAVLERYAGSDGRG